ncbi:MAG: glycine--tRNA ligase [Dehalococcoidia bacterium]|nr:glycine--tRNA ligase [Dehalococcoidia bacterium]|tara:strand:+ start:2299 stop:3639 length:1341 start_codon:yes stop_codon:yes gene_type:complete
MEPSSEKKVTLPKLVSLSKRRGFVFPASEIYGGIGSTWDYGPLGVELKRNIKDAWWRSVVTQRDDVVGLDSAIIQSPRVWEASGHAEVFTDPLVECPECRKRFRADHLEDQLRCPDDGSTLGDPRQFNLMFKTFSGPVEDSANQVWLRPETAQGIFINFENVLNSTRMKLPFGIAQIGKSFRNEITTGNFIFRTREFEQAEMEFFVKPGQDEEWFNYWINQRMDWFVKLGIDSSHLRIRKHEDAELSHYSRGTSDIEFDFPWGVGELEGIARRSDFDLASHSQSSGTKLEYFDQDTGTSYYPWVIEPALGVDRAALAFMSDAYTEENTEKDQRVLFKFHPDIAPVQIAVLPLSRNEKLVPTARGVFNEIRSVFPAQYDDAQSIGRRYRRQDEIGTPLCITIDFETVESDKAVTIRNRDTMQQSRTLIKDLIPEIKDHLSSMGSTRS